MLEGKDDKEPLGNELTSQTGESKKAEKRKFGVIFGIGSDYVRLNSTTGALD